MSFVALIAFLGLAAVSLDPFGGIVAATALARGASRGALATLLGVYTLATTIEILVLHPVLQLLGRLLAGVLAAHLTWSIAQLVVALALLGVAAHQARASLRPGRTREGPARTGPLALAGAALLLAITSMPDPPFIAAVGIAGHVRPPLLGIALLVIWNVIYQAPMVLLAGAGLLGAGPRAARIWARVVTDRRVGLQRVLAGVLALAGVAGILDALLALRADAFPVLHLLLAG